MISGTRRLLDAHMRDCEHRGLTTDRKLDKIEAKVESACAKFEEVGRRISDGVKDLHEENQTKIDAIDTKLDALPWKLLTWAGTLVMLLLGILATILRSKLGL